MGGEKSVGENENLKGNNIKNIKGKNRSLCSRHVLRGERGMGYIWRFCAFAVL